MVLEVVVILVILSLLYYQFFIYEPKYCWTNGYDTYCTKNKSIFLGVIQAYRRGNYSPYYPLPNSTEIGTIAVE